MSGCIYVFRRVECWAYAAPRTVANSYGNVKYAVHQHHFNNVLLMFAGVYSSVIGS